MARKITAAIDIGSSKITTVITAVEDDDQPTVIGVCSHPSRGIKKGVVVNIEDATNSISESLTAAERMAGVTISDVYVSINGEQINSINNKGVVAVSGTEITIEDTYRAIENARTLTLPENLNPIHIIPRGFIVDNQSGIKYPIGMTGGRLEVETHIITAPDSYWKNIRKCVDTLGLNVYDVVFTGWASSQAVLTETEKELGVTLLDIGAGTTSISIFDEGSIIFSASIPLGGSSVTSDLAIGLQVTLEEAEKIKVRMSDLLDDKVLANKEEDKTPALLRKTESEEEEDETPKDLVDVTGLGVKSQEHISKSLLTQIVEARIEEILDMAKDTVAKAGYDIKMPAGVVLSGGTSLLRSINKIAQSTYGVPARVGYPSGLTGMVEEISDPAYSTVQGLIKHALDDDADASAGSGSLGGTVGGMFSGIVDWVKSLLP